ncbi:MAG TPA: hypothetical protein DDY91_18475 [Planctomycetaceae bacterium]|nr:hypothetical protein [Planctomycetaceae bacterium]
MDTGHQIQSIGGGRVLQGIIDGKAVVVASRRVGQSGLMQDIINPNPRSPWKPMIVECTDRLSSNCQAKCIQ